MIKIITHNGRAHRDDFLAVCITLATVDNPAMVIRKEWPSEEELNNPETFVLDFGKEYNPAKLNFDHHHIVGGEQCAFTLILEHFGMRDYNAMPWIKYVEVDDHCGPMATGTLLGNGGKNVKEYLFNPLEEYFIDQFSQKAEMMEGDWLYDLMKKIGKLIQTQYLNYQEDKKAIEKCVEIENYLGFVVAKSSTLKRHVWHSNAFYTFCKENKVDIIFGSNDRGAGAFRLTRRAERIDFNKAAGIEGVKFIHQSGFLIAFDGNWKDIISTCIL